MYTYTIYIYYLMIYVYQSFEAWAKLAQQWLVYVPL